MGRTVEDTLAIQDVVVRYGYVVDDRDWDAFDQVFTDDAIVDFRIYDTDPPSGLAPLIGRDEIVRQYRDVLTHPYQHMIVAQLIDDVSDDEVIVRCKALFPVPGNRIVDSFYRDVVVRTPQGWRIKHKSIKRYNPELEAWVMGEHDDWKERGADVQTAR